MDSKDLQVKLPKIAGVNRNGVGSMAGIIHSLGDQRVKLVLNEGIEVRDLYRLASEYDVQIRRLSCKRDSLEDIFLKAMENGHGGL